MAADFTLALQRATATKAKVYSRAPLSHALVPRNLEPPFGVLPRRQYVGRAGHRTLRTSGEPSSAAWAGDPP